MIQTKSVTFANEIVNLCKSIAIKHKEYVLSKQLLRSGTAIGALVKEAEHGQSKADFLHKMNIALKEANETIYWVDLLKEGSYLTLTEYSKTKSDAMELVRILASIVKTTKSKLNIDR